jgi:hypothetical protein
MESVQCFWSDEVQGERVFLSRRLSPSHNIVVKRSIATMTLLSAMNRACRSILMAVFSPMQLMTLSFRALCIPRNGNIQNGRSSGG